MASRLTGLIAAQGKALGTHAAFVDRSTPVEVVDLNRSPPRASRTTISQREASRHLGAYGGEQAIDWVMDCVRFTADTVANAEYHFERPKKATGRQVPGEQVDPPERLAELIDQPNPYMDYIELMELVIIDLLMVGNAYLYKWRTNAAGQPLALYRLAPPCTKVEPEPWGVGGYTYDVPGAGKLEIPAKEVIHFKLANPHSPYYGLGLIQGAGRSADLELALTDTSSSYFENHAMPSLAVQSERRVPRDVFKKIRAQLRARTQGSRNAGELLVLEAGLKLAAVAPNASQAGFGELSRMSRDRVFAWFRMSPKLLGVIDEAGGADKIADAQRIFDNKTARPLMNKVQRKLSSELVKAWDLAYKIDYEYQMAPEDLARLAGSYATIPGITIDEVRQFARLGKHPDPEIGKLTINLPGEDGGTGQPGDPTRQGHPDPNLPGEAGRPPKWENTRAIRPGSPMPPNTAAGKALSGAKSIEEVLARLDVLAIGQSEGKAAAADTRVEGEIRPDSLAARRVADTDAIIADFTSELTDAARVLERSLLDNAEGKALPTDIVRRIRASKGWLAFTELVESAYRRAIQRALSTAAVHHGDLGLTPEEDIDYDGIAAELAHAKDTGVRAITKTLKDIVANKVKAARDSGASQQDVLAVVRQAVADWTGSQAETIAMTETTRGYNEGTLAVAEATGHTHVDVYDGDDHDEPCIEANGQRWPIAKARENTLQHPRCRRAFVPVPVTS